MIDINQLVTNWGKVQLNEDRFSTEETDYLVGEDVGLCVNCKKPTHFVDIYTEVRICCKKCEKEFYTKFHEWEKAAEERFKEDL